MSTDVAKGSGFSAKRAGIGVVIGMYALVGLPIGIAILLLAYWGQALLVWIVAAVLLFIINILSCSWIQREWVRWMSGSRTSRLEARLDKWRSGKLRGLVTGITDGLTAWFILSSFLTNVIITVSLARLVSGRPVPQRKVVITTVFFPSVFSGLFVLVGRGLKDVT